MDFMIFKKLFLYRKPIAMERAMEVGLLLARLKLKEADFVLLQGRIRIQSHPDATAMPLTWLEGHSSKQDLNAMSRERWSPSILPRRIKRGTKGSVYTYSPCV